MTPLTNLTTPLIKFMNNQQRNLEYYIKIK